MPVPPQLLPRQWIIPKGVSRERKAEEVRAFVAALDSDKGWRVTVEEHKPIRTSQANAYLWGVVYDRIAKATGYERDEVHEFCCGLHFGWKDKPTPKTPRNPSGIESVPIRTTTRDAEGKPRTLSKLEFAEYVDRVRRFAASKGIHIPEPGEYVAEEAA